MATKIDSWQVSIEANGETILTIGDNHLSGRHDIDEYADLVRKCADHLNGFIGGHDEKGV